jgi:hypothetical protein
MKLLNLMVLALFLQGSLSYADDGLIGESGLNRIKVTKNSDNEYSFEFCSYENSREEVCESLSEKTFTEEDLAQIAKSEKTEAWLKTAGVTLGSILVIGASFAGFVTAAWAVWEGAGVMTSVFMAASGAATLSPLSIPFIKKLNPVRQFKQAQVLTKNNFMDSDVTVSEKDVKKAAQLLREILN